MDWVYLIWILAFIAWSVQMLVAYRSQVGRIQHQIDLPLANQGEVSEQAEQHEVQAKEKKDMLNELESKSEELASR